MFLTEEMFWAIGAVLVFILLDVVTGLVSAFKNGEYSSTKMREGIFHKAAIIIVMVAAAAVELFVLHVPSLGFSVPILVPVCVLLTFMEITSILENVVIINPDLAGNKVLDLFKKED